MDIDKRNTVPACAFDTLFEQDVPHIQEKIFFSLDFESFKMCVKVCSTWHRLLTSKSFLVRAKSHFKEIERDEQSLWIVAKCGDKKGMENLLSTGLLDVNYMLQGSTPLHQAARKGHGSVVQILLYNGADIERENDMGKTPLLIAVSSRQINVICRLLDKGADPNRAHRQDGGTPLHRAAREGCEDVMKLLLERGADPHKANQVGATPLHWASVKGNANMVKMLLRRGTGRRFNRKHFGLSFGLKNGLRFHFDSEACLKYPFLNIFLV